MRLAALLVVALLAAPVAAQVSGGTGAPAPTPDATVTGIERDYEMEKRLAEFRGRAEGERAVYERLTDAGCRIYTTIFQEGPAYWRTEKMADCDPQSGLGDGIALGALLTGLVTLGFFILTDYRRKILEARCEALRHKNRVFDLENYIEWNRRIDRIP